MTTVKKEQKEQRNRGQRQLQTEGILYAEQTREMTKQRKEESGIQKSRA